MAGGGKKVRGALPVCLPSGEVRGGSPLAVCRAPFVGVFGRRRCSSCLKSPTGESGAQTHIVKCIGGCFERMLPPAATFSRGAAVGLNFKIRSGRAAVRVSGDKNKSGKRWCRAMKLLWLELRL